MRLGEFIYESLQPRALPSIGTAIGLPLLAVSVVAEETSFQRWFVLAAGVFIAAGHLAKLAVDFNRGMRLSRLTDADQQEQIDDLRRKDAEQKKEIADLRRRVETLEAKA